MTKKYYLVCKSLAAGKLVEGREDLEGHFPYCFDPISNFEKNHFGC
jgi:hypothetical protein